MQQTGSTTRFAGSNPPPAGRWIQEFGKATAFIMKDMRIAVSYRLQFAFQFLQIFFSVAVIYFIGKMLADAGKSSLLEEYRTDYFSFALVGLAINSYLRGGMEGITNEVRQTMNQGVLEALCAPPINYAWLLMCSSLWQFAFETMRVIFYFLIAMVVFGMRLQGANWIGAIVSLILTASIFLMLGIMSCSILVLVKRGDPVYWVFSRATSLLAGIMFPISVFPYWLRLVAFCFPLTHSLEAMRQCLFAGATVSQVSRSIWALVGFLVVLTPLTVLVNNLCMRKAKRSGAFTTH
ncbi:MAG TPA: ABC transporter permease [Sedimentisphaerales bacterium]|nr:ABC transporter permease [Sedimentisphaerales bacterium]